jgi:hypothetical protein
MSNYRWTVRNVDPQAVELLHSVKQDNPESTLGELLSEAIQDWYENLEEVESNELLDYGPHLKHKLLMPT